MTQLLHQLIFESCARAPEAEALRHKSDSLNYAQLEQAVRHIADGLLKTGLKRQARVAIYLPKCIEAVVAFFGTSMAGGIFVPINPLLKPEQVGHILKDCNATILITSSDRLTNLSDTLQGCNELSTCVVTGALKSEPDSSLKIIEWQQIVESNNKQSLSSAKTIDADIAAILYTSGSTGKPKGVVLSHKNMVTGAHSVAHYLGNTSTDRILAVLPFSFDYGFSQLSTAFHVGASVVLMDYLFPRDVIKAIAKEHITGLAAVPPLWIQLADLDWPEETQKSLRYITNSGGAMPTRTLEKLRVSLPSTLPYLMYGLTEAFRSTYLDPSEIDKRPDSMGKAIPNAEVMVVRPDGSQCDIDEPGELVHRGNLVALGYWNDSEKTAEHFKPVPQAMPDLPLTEIAVWSGDTVKQDSDGFLYFVSRNDEMIKTSGFRVSPSEVEEIIDQSGLTVEVAAMGITHPTLGQAIVVAVVSKSADPDAADTIQAYCKQQMPSYMVPTKIIILKTLPRNPNGKIDRKLLLQKHQTLFQD